MDNRNSRYIGNCTTIHRYPIFSTRYSVMGKIYTRYQNTSEIEHGLCAYVVDNPLTTARGVSLRTGAQTNLPLTGRPIEHTDQESLIVRRRGRRTSTSA